MIHPAAVALTLVGLAVSALAVQPALLGSADLFKAIGNVVSHTTVVSPTEYQFQTCDPYKCSLVIIDQHGVDEFNWTPTEPWSDPTDRP